MFRQPSGALTAGEHSPRPAAMSGRRYAAIRPAAGEDVTVDDMNPGSLRQLQAALSRE
jgi:hypothetical protein